MKSQDFRDTRPNCLFVYALRQLGRHAVDFYIMSCCNLLEAGEVMFPAQGMAYLFLNR